jgi:uncharacterized DUF497 family protein
MRTSFFNDPLLLFADDDNALVENRFFILGKTDIERKLFIVFTMRKNLIRIIDMSKKERKIYEKSEENTKI